MFGKTPTVVHVGSKNHHHSHNTTITEKKAPTDESLKLLNEYKKEAIDSILERGLIKVPSIKAEIAYARRQDIFCQFIDFRLILNGKTIKGSYEVDTTDKINLDKFMEVVLSRVVIELSKEIIKKEYK